MSIFDKIEEIRQQPERVRLRWAWGLTAFSMVFVIVLWAILLAGQTSNLSQGTPKTGEDLSSQFNQQKKSIKDAVGQMKGVVDNVNKSATASNPVSGDASNVQSNPTNSGEGFSPDSNSNSEENSVSSSN